MSIAFPVTRDPRGRRRAASWAVLLLGAAVAAVLLWRPVRLDAADARLSRRALVEVARLAHVSPESLEKAAGSAVVRHGSDGDCVELRYGWPSRRPLARACYDPVTGKEREIRLYGDSL